MISYIFYRKFLKKDDNCYSQYRESAMKIQSLTLILVIISIFISVQPVSSMEFHVDNASELQAALAAAGSNGGDDIIYLSAGTYLGNFRYAAKESNSLELRPTVGVENGAVILDGGQQGYVLLLVRNEFDVDFIIEGLTIQNGYSMESGGGIYSKQTYGLGTTKIKGCSIVNNHAALLGGGVYLSLPDSIIEDSNIINNSSLNGGGGISSGSSTLITNNEIRDNSTDGDGGAVKSDHNCTFTNNLITGNSAQRGGGVCAGSSSTFNNNVIERNSATREGGGVCSLGSSFFNNKIIRNSASNDGGGTWCGGEDHISIFIDNIVNENSAGAAGGAINLSGAGTFVGNIIYGNSANVELGAIWAGNHKEHSFKSNSIVSNIGSGIYTRYTSLNIVNNTIANNTNKGLICIPWSNATTNLYNNIIWGNQATDEGSDIYMSGYGIESNFYNNIYSSAFALWDNEDGNLVIDPLFYDVLNSDFHVTIGSPALNAGLNSAPELPASDLDGNPRILDGIVDIGAYERTTAALHPADLNENWIIEQTEFDNYNDAWRNNSTWGVDPNPIPIDFVSRAGYLLQSGGGYHNIGVGKPACWVSNN